MTRDDAATDAAVCELLSRWHQWQNVRHTRGFAPKALVVGEFRISRQYDDANGALDAELDHFQMKQVDFEVSQIQEPYKAAIYCLARALTVGVMVFVSPRLPQDKAQREALVSKAKAMATDRFMAAGLL